MSIETPENASSKKNNSQLVWVGVGCGGLLVVGAIIFGIFMMNVVNKGKEFVENPTKVIAELAISKDPELELIESDDVKGTITFRNLTTGEVATLNFEDIAEGRFSVTTEEGEFNMDVSGDEEGGSMVISGPEGEMRFGAGTSAEDVPDWVPLYPGASDPEGTYSANTEEGMAGAVTIKTDDDAQKVLDHYKEVLENAGYTVTTQVTTSGQSGTEGMVFAVLEGQERSVTVILGQEGDQTQIVIQYASKQQ